MSAVFTADYAGAYDSFYQDKDYAVECDLLEKVFQRYSTQPVHSILDLGCGTGNHAIPLALRGYEVCGVDLSPAMLERARQKSVEAGLRDRIQFQQSPINELDLSQTFDAALMMFAVLGYQIENQDVVGALKAARRHLKPGGLFTFDVWYGPCVLREGVSDRVKIVQTGGGQFIRVAKSSLDSRSHTCTVHYQVWHTTGDKIVNQVQEDHVVRFFFPRELELLLGLSSFELLALGSFPDIDLAPAETTWNVTGVARAI